MSATLYGVSLRTIHTLRTIQSARYLTAAQSFFIPLDNSPVQKWLLARLSWILQASASGLGIFIFEQIKISDHTPEQSKTNTTSDNLSILS